LTYERRDHDQCCDEKQSGRNPVVQEGPVIATRQHKCSAVIGFHHEPEHHTEHHWQYRHMPDAHTVTDCAEDEGQADMEQASFDGIHARDNERINEAGQIRSGAADQPDARAHDQVTHDNHREVGDEQARIQVPHDIAVLHEQHRSGDESMDQESAKQHGRRIRPGNAEAEHRNERSARDGIVRGLRRRDPFGRAVTELLLMARPAARLVVREKRRHGAAAARDDALQRANDRADRLRQRETAPHRTARHDNPCPFTGRRAPSSRVALDQQLADRVDAYHDQDRGNAREQLGPVERKASRAGDGVRSDAGHDQPEHARHQSLHQRFARQCGDDAQTEDAEREVRRRGKRECNRR
jgi:hypothetical protein